MPVSFPRSPSRLGMMCQTKDPGLTGARQPHPCTASVDWLSWVRLKVRRLHSLRQSTLKERPQQGLCCQGGLTGVAVDTVSLPSALVRCACAHPSVGRAAGYSSQLVHT